MSCGNPHAKPCDEVLQEVYLYLDGEISEHDCEHIRQHLDECGPCLREYGVEQEVKALVARSCGCESAPAELRTRLKVTLQSLRIDGTGIDVATVEFRTEQ
jgi:mycothiol system anti-sigma-R factor